MADFRKWFFAFAVIALMLGAFTAQAQIANSNSITCVNTPSTPTIARVEGITELMGDFVLNCTGGVPTPSGNLIPQFNVALTINANVTSRLLASTYGAGTRFIDALLTIDEPFPGSATQFPSNVNPPIGAPTKQAVCAPNTSIGTASVPTNCNLMTGLFNTTTNLFTGNPYNPLGPNGVNAYNVFVGQTGATAGQVVWLGVPIDAPGTAGTRVIRLTNIRANACGVGLSSGLIPSQITGFISVTGSTNLTIAGSGQQTLAYVQAGLTVSSKNAQLQQCVSTNVGGAGLAVSSVVGNFGSATGGFAISSITLAEGFASAFKRRIAAYTVVTDVNDVNNTTPILQDVPGYNYNSETAFQPSVGASSPVFGTANTGTRFLLVFNNIPTGATVYLPQFVPLTLLGSSTTGGSPIPISNVSGWTGGFIELIGNTSDTNGNPSSVPGTTNSVFNAGVLASVFGISSPFKGPGATGNFATAVQIPVTNGTAAAVYEVGNADPAAQEQANVPIGFAYTANTSTATPTAGQVTATASFAPLSTVITPTATDPIPRFCNKSTPQNIVNINLCTCDLLFPFVTNIGGFDTGIAIANTSLDTATGHSVAAQNGNVTLYFYGSLPGTPAPATIAPQTTTSPVNAGQELLFTLSSGGSNGITQETGFTGYIIAVAQFQFCHGFAFISDLGAQRLAEGYLAIGLDIPGLNRVATVGEVQAH